ncbi:MULTISPECIES: multinuclear nonheme iron-dependent oxidase [unclassified Methylobacterium]|uniref:multinuclear nonheme iron-dependent oxidase n=1 Tax=unclassified Methylobacterium TaxID=2615210 RepID=UPI000152DE76|nr:MULTISPECIES: DUF692 family multinuclear iron-containing protein [Methylobacterium]WFT80822.1 DUF692 family protein [Methylobacterium nodulans]
MQDGLERPLLPETITADFAIPGATMSEPEFLHRLTGATGCGLRLDVTNVEVNAANHGFDARAFLAALPLDRVVQVHLAGGAREGGRLIDTHGAPVSEVSWELLAALAARAPVRAVLLERDLDFSDPEGLIAEVARARVTVARAAA